MHDAKFHGLLPWLFTWVPQSRIKSTVPPTTGVTPPSAHFASAVSGPQVPTPITVNLATGTFVRSLNVLTECIEKLATPTLIGRHLCHVPWLQALLRGPALE